MPLGDLIYLDRERCIQCARCIRFQDEVVDDPVIAFHNRGRRLEIVTFPIPASTATGAATRLIFARWAR